MELARRTAGRTRARATATSSQLAEEIERTASADRTSWTSLESSEDIPKSGRRWAVEKIGRLKPNGQLTGYSPLSRVVELEGLALGITGKLSLWKALRELSTRSRGSTPPSSRPPRSGPSASSWPSTGAEQRNEVWRCAAAAARRSRVGSKPMSWEPELDELRRREELARRMGGDERVARQHASGRLTVRERIERLLDAGSFHETGALAGRGAYDDDGELTDFLPANTVVGQGRIDGRRVVVQGDDFTVRGGAADAAIWEKMVYAERLAHELRIPLVRLVDGTGGGGSVKTLETMGFSYVPPLPGLRPGGGEPVDGAGRRRRARARWPASAPRAWSARTSR